MTEHLNREQSAPDRANRGVDRVPDGVHPWDFVGEKFEEIKNTSDANNPWVAEDFERLILLGQSDPMKMDREPSSKDGEIKIDAGQRSETEGDGEKVQSFHDRNIQRRLKD